MGQVLMTLWAGGSLIWIFVLVTRAVSKGALAQMMRKEIEHTKVEAELQRLRHEEFAQRERDRCAGEELNVKRTGQAQRVVRASAASAIFLECPWCEQERHHLFEVVGEGKPGRVAWWLSTAKSSTSSRRWSDHMLMPYELVSGPDAEMERWELRKQWRDVWPWVRTCVSCGSEWGQITL